MEMGSCQCHCLDTADAVFRHRLYDLSRNFLKNSVIFAKRTSYLWHNNIKEVYYG